MTVTGENAQLVIADIFTHLRDWRMTTAEQFRNAALGYECMFAVNPLMNGITEKDVLYLRDVIRQVIAGGRMIDFGHLPNEVIRTESRRSGPMFDAGEFQQPYESWIGVTSWEGGFNGYFVSQAMAREITMNSRDVMMMEIYGVNVPNVGPAIIVYDAVSVFPTGDGSETYVNPVVMNSADMMSQIELRKRGANCLEPLIMMLRLLADASIPVEHSIPDERLNRSRLKRGRAALPPHTVVRTRDYVSEFHSSAGRPRSPGQGGHHASPTAHWRRAHPRHLASGRVVQIKPMKVNWRDGEELHRLFYKVKEHVSE